MPILIEMEIRNLKRSALTLLLILEFFQHVLLHLCLLFQTVLERNFSTLKNSFFVILLHCFAPALIVTDLPKADGFFANFLISSEKIGLHSDKDHVHSEIYNFQFLLIVPSSTPHF